MSFKFKQFTIDDSDCAMKVGTDSVLLGSWMNVTHANVLLDIGTGCGILALMAAQQSMSMITAIDIDQAACSQAFENFKNSRWVDRINCLNQSIQTFAPNHKKRFDHIITNPPFFSNSLKSPVIDRNTARHNDELPFETLVMKVATMLVKDGKFSIILPFNDYEVFTGICATHSLWPSRQLFVFPKQGKPVNRVLMEFTNTNQSVMDARELVIRLENNEYTSEYKNLTSEFYLNF